MTATTDDTTTTGPWVSGILVPMLPVTDLTRSASFYGALLGLELRREFVRDGQVTGLALGRGDHAARLDPIVFEHDDAVLVRVVDPDDIDVYVAVSKRPWTSFQGYTRDPDGYRATHTSALSGAAGSAGR